MTAKSIPDNWVIKNSAQDVAEAVRDDILHTAEQAIKNNGRFSIVLAGGTTPKTVYELLAKEPCDWQHWYCYIGDERCLPVDHVERNSRMIERCLLNKVNIPQKNIHFIPAELGAKEASSTYQPLIKEALPFDLVMLGMGEDGHTASLFPAHKHDVDKLVHAVSDAPKAPSERVTLSVKALSSNDRLLIMVTGASKQNAVQLWKADDGLSATPPTALPIAQVSSRGEATVYLDKDAFESQ